MTLADGDTVKIVENRKDFADVPDGYWGVDAVDFATSWELFNGTSKTAFTPDGNMTRTMIVTVLARYEGVDTSDDDTWYDAGRDWAMQASISDSTDMEGTLTREQLVTMLYRVMCSPRDRASPAHGRSSWTIRTRTRSEIMHMRRCAGRRCTASSTAWATVRLLRKEKQPVHRLRPC